MLVTLPLLLNNFSLDHDSLFSHTVFSTFALVKHDSSLKLFGGVRQILVLISFMTSIDFQNR